MTKKMQEYTEEFKQGAVNMVLKEGLSRSDVGRRLGTSCKNISRWVKEHQTNKPSAQSNTSTAALQKKIGFLEKENRRLQMEREILKKAAAFFANESN